MIYGSDDSSSSGPPSVSHDSVDGGVDSSGGPDDSDSGSGVEMAVEVLDGVRSGLAAAGKLQRGLACQDLPKNVDSWSKVVNLWKSQPGLSSLVEAMDRHN